MTVADFASEFAECRSVREADDVYRQLFHQHNARDMAVYQPLSDAHRRALERITLPDEQQPKSQSDPSQPGRIRSRELRNWCRQQGIPLAKMGKVSLSIENQYREAHDMPLRKVLVSVDMTGISHGAVRAWARENGIPVGERGRVAPEVVAKYQAAQGE